MELLVISRILFPAGAGWRPFIYPPVSRRIPAGAGCDQYPETYRRSGTGQAARFPCSVLHRVGFALPPPLPDGAVSSYLAFSPLPGRSRAVCFLWHFPSAPHYTGRPRLFTGRAALWCPDFPLDRPEPDERPPRRSSKLAPYAPRCRRSTRIGATADGRGLGKGRFKRAWPSTPLK